VRPWHLLPRIACLTLFATILSAQEPLPTSTQARLARLARLETLTQGDFADILSKAKSGNREAQFELATLYTDGRLVPRDDAAVRDWMLKSAEQGYAPAQEAMGRIYLKTRGSVASDYGEADRWLRQAAMQGDAEAQFWLGTGYEQGWFGGSDYQEALKWLRMAAEHGLPDAQFCLGQMYEDGEGVQQSNLIAARWYRKAADHSPSYLGGVREAEVQLVYMYRDGGLPTDDVEAYMWFAIVGSSVDPPTDEDIKEVARHMTQAQIAQAQTRAADWIKRHTLQSGTLAQAAR
jgi:TPR repeat protein